MPTPILTILLTMVSIQSGAALAKSLFINLGPEGATAYRIGFSAVMLLIVFRPRVPRGRALLRVALYGASLGLMNLTFYLAIARIPLGPAVALEFSGPLALTLLSSRTPRDFLWIALATVGLGLLTPAWAATSRLDPVGIGFALLAGFFWALYIVFGRRAGRDTTAGAVTAIGMSVAALVVVPVALFTKGAALFDQSVLPSALGVALLASAIPYSCEMIAMRQMPAKQFGLLMSLEPAFAALSGFVFLREVLTTTQLLAIGLIIAAVVGSTVYAGPRRAPAALPSI